MKKLLLTLGYLILLGMLGICCFIGYYFWYRSSLHPDSPPETFREGDLVGIWQADYRHYEWERCEGPTDFQTREARFLIERLVLREDRTFYQVLQDRRGEIPDQHAQGTWWVERFSDGVTRLHLEKGRFFAEEVCEFFPRLSPLTVMRGYSPLQDGHPVIFNPQEEVVIVVGWDKYIKELYLEYPLVGNPDAPIIVEFKRVPGSEMDSMPGRGP